jgi:hypothetical protein
MTIMIDQETQAQLLISTDEDSGPYLMVPRQQLPEVLTVLRRHAVAHSVDDDAIQFDGKPVIVVVNFGRGADAARLQRLLDEAA